MSATTASQVGVTIEWDDSVMIIFSFQGSSGTVTCGFPHVIPSVQSTSGTQTQLSAQLQKISQFTVQMSADPATWVETVKFGARGNKITIDFDDTINVSYTTVTNNSFQLQELYSIRG